MSALASLRIVRAAAVAAAAPASAATKSYWTAAATTAASSSSSSASAWRTTPRRRTLATVSDGAPPKREEDDVQDKPSDEGVTAVQAEVAAAVMEAASDAVAAAPLTPSASKSPIYTSLIISRPPLLLREPGKFEAAMYAYNEKLTAALAQPFPRDFYVKKGSTAEQRFDDAETRRLTSLAAGSTDPLSFRPDASSTTGGASAQAGGGPAQGERNAEADLYATLPRTTEADKKNDVRSLNRKLDRTLYLLIKANDQNGKRQGWTFPSKRVVRSGPGKENLHTAAQKAVASQLGNEIDVWLVSNLPIGVIKPENDADARTYFMQAHVLAGNVSSPSHAEKDSGSAPEYAWLTREEIEQRLSSSSGRGGDTSQLSFSRISDFLRA